jgi:hypothetical protein
MVIVIIASFIYVANQKNPYGEEVDITNLAELSAGRPSDSNTLFFIKNNLYKVILMNLDYTIKADDIKDITIRTGTFDQTYDEKTNVNTVKFIVDIKSLKQSYQVSYQWSSNKNNDNLAEYGTLVTCLPTNLLKYGDFNCKDMLTEEGETPDIPNNPIIRVLPIEVSYYTPDFTEYTEYTISYEDSETNKDGFVLVITDKTGGNKDQALQMIRDKGFNPDDYEVVYNYTPNKPSNL